MELLIFVKHRWADFGGHWKEQLGVRESKLSLYLDKKAKSVVDRLFYTVKFNEAYNSITKRGDIVEVHEDGWWKWLNKKNPNNNMKDCFAAVQISGEPNIDFAKPLKTDTERIVYKHRYYVTSYFELGKLIKDDNIIIVDKVSK